MGVVLESSRSSNSRFEFSAVDFRRIRDFCGLLGLALVFYAFTSDEESRWDRKFAARFAQRPECGGFSGLHAATIVPRWLPIILFLLMAAQNFSEAGCIHHCRRYRCFFRWRQRMAGGVLLEKSTLNIAYPYLILCVFSAGIHANDGTKDLRLLGAVRAGCVGAVAAALTPISRRDLAGRPGAGDGSCVCG